jgi:hypothetical protein
MPARLARRLRDEEHRHPSARPVLLSFPSPSLAANTQATRSARKTDVYLEQSETTAFA